MKGIEQRPRLYDTGMAVLEAMGLAAWRASLVRDLPERQMPTSILEVGCGTGRTLALHPSDRVVIGTDPAFDLLRTARGRAPHALLVQARAEALPFPAGSVDQVVSSLVFCSVDDPVRALGEIRRVLRADGLLRMLEHVRPEGRLLGWLASVVQPVWTAVTGGCHPDRDTEATVRASGFSILPETRQASRSLRRLDALHPDRGHGTTVTEMGVESPSE
jgi:ubiquinone/menaquinone biosynthesis C-methylase UbiE